MFHRRAIAFILLTLLSGDQISNVVAFSKCSLISTTAFRLSTTELFNLKSSHNGSSMSRKKMLQMRRKGKFDIYMEDGSSSSEMMALDDTESSSSCAVAGVHDRVVDEHTTRGSRAEVAKLKRSKKRTKGSSKATKDNVDASSDDDHSEIRNSGLSQLEYLKLLDSRPALVLNADYQPLSHIPLSLWCWQDSVKAVFSGRVTVVDTYPDITVRGIGIEMPVPSVIALNQYIPQASKKNPAFTRRNVFLRDGYRCQYCNHMFKGHELSLDHVIPKCLGGTLRWYVQRLVCTNDTLFTRFIQLYFS